MKHVFIIIVSLKQMKIFRVIASELWYLYSESTNRWRMVKGRAYCGNHRRTKEVGRYDNTSNQYILHLNHHHQGEVVSVPAPNNIDATKEELPSLSIMSSHSRTSPSNNQAHGLLKRITMPSNPIHEVQYMFLLCIYEQRKRFLLCMNRKHQKHNY